MAILALVGRVLLSLIFIGAGANKIPSFQTTLAFMTQHQLPFPELLLPLTILVEIGGGVAIAVGYRTRAAAVLLALFLIPATLVFHSELVIHHDADQTVQFMKNLAIMGGLLTLAANGPGSWSADARPRRARLTLSN